MKALGGTFNKQGPFLGTVQFRDALLTALVYSWNIWAVWYKTNPITLSRCRRLDQWNMLENILLTQSLYIRSPIPYQSFSRKDHFEFHFFCYIMLCVHLWNQFHGINPLHKIFDISTSCQLITTLYEVFIFVEVLIHVLCM